MSYFRIILKYCKSFTDYRAYLNNRYFTEQETNTYIAVTLKEIWRVACADFIPFQANYSFTDIWFGVIWAFHNYNVSSERKKQKQKINRRTLSTNYLAEYMGILKNYSCIR